MIDPLPTRRFPRNASVIGTAGLATLSILVAGCASSGSNSSKQLPVLHIGTGTARTANAAGEGANAPAAVAPGPMIPIFGGYVVSGTLPTTPTAARIWQWTSARASEDEVRRLGSALNLDGTPLRHAYGWELETSGGDLRVSDLAGNQWSFNRTSGIGCATQPIDIDDPHGASSAVGCAVPIPGQPNTPASGPDDATTRAAVAGLISTLGLAGAEQVSVGAPTSELTLTPVVGGLSTAGIETDVSVDDDGIADATGWLANPSAGQSYPLQTAKSAFAELGSRPEPMLAPYCGPIPQPDSGSQAPAESTVVPPAGVVPPIAIAPEASAPIATGPAVSAAVSTSGPVAIGVASPPPNPVTAPSPISVGSPIPVDSPVACPSPKPVEITAAHLGLQIEYDSADAASETPILVPVWIFSTADSTSVATIVAIDPSFLGDQSATGSAESGAGNASTGTVITGPPAGAPASDVPGATTGSIDPAPPTP